MQIFFVIYRKTLINFAEELSGNHFLDRNITSTTSPLNDVEFVQFQV